MVAETNLPAEAAGLSMFEHADFGKVRVVMRNGEAWFLAKDVCDILDIRTNNIRTILDADEVDTLNDYSIDLGPGSGGKAPLIISDAGLYGLILVSRKPNARAFKRWVKHDVLPAIGRTGGFIPVNPGEPPLELVARTLRIVEETMRLQAEKIAADAPKVELADTFLTQAQGEITVGTLGKMWGQAGYTWKSKRFSSRNVYEFLRERGILGKRKGHDWNIPNQKAINEALFRVVERVVDTDGGALARPTCYVTPKGVDNLTRRLRRWKEKYEPAAA